MADVIYHIDLPPNARLPIGVVIEAMYRALRVGSDDIGAVFRDWDKLVLHVSEDAVSPTLSQVLLHLQLGGSPWLAVAKRSDALPMAAPKFKALRWMPVDSTVSAPPLAELRTGLFETLGLTADEVGAITWKDGVLQIDVDTFKLPSSPLPDRIRFGDNAWFLVSDEHNADLPILHMVQRFLQTNGALGAQKLREFLQPSQPADDGPVEPPSIPINVDLPITPNPDETPSEIADGQQPPPDIGPVPTTMTNAILSGDFVDDDMLDSPSGRAFFRKLPSSVIQQWFERNAARVQSPYDLWRHVRLRHRWAQVDPSFTQPSPTAVQTAMLSYLNHVPLDDRDQRTLLGLRAQGYRFDSANVEHPALKLTAPLIREVCSTLSRDSLNQLLTTLKQTLDPEGKYGPAISALQQGLSDHDLNQQDGPASPLLHTLYDLGAGADVWLLAGGRLVSGLGRLCYRFPAIQTVIADMIVPTGHNFSSHDDVDQAFRAAWTGDEALATHAITRVDAAFSAIGLGQWSIGRLILAELAERRGDITTASARITEAQSHSGQWPEVFLWYADCEAAQGNDAQALTLLQPLRRHPFARARLGRLHFRLAQLQQARALGFHGETQTSSEPVSDLFPSAPSWSQTDALALVSSLDSPPSPRKRQLWVTAGYGALAIAELQQRYLSGAADEREVLELAEMALNPTFATAITVPRGPLAERVLMATGVALPGAWGLDAVRSAALAAQLISSHGDRQRWRTISSIHRDVLDRTLERGEVSPWLTVAWLEWMVHQLESGYPEAWEQRQGWCLRLLRQTPIQDASLLTLAQKLYVNLNEHHPTVARFFADGMVAALPETAGALESGDQDMAEATLNLLRAVLPPENQDDDRLKHAPDRRITAAEEHLTQHRWESALAASAALCNRELLPTYRYRATRVLLSALEKTDDGAGQTLIRKVLAKAAEGPQLVGWPVWQALLATTDPRWLGPTWAAIEPIFRTRTVGFHETAALADLFGHCIATVLADLPWTGYKVPTWAYWDSVTGKPYWLARALVAGTHTLIRLLNQGHEAPVPLTDARPSWFEPLADAVRAAYLDPDGVFSVKPDLVGTTWGFPESTPTQITAVLRLLASLPVETRPDQLSAGIVVTAIRVKG